MKCDRCDQEDVTAKRRMVGLDDDGIPIRHHECPAGHRFHFPVDAAGAEMKVRPCDCSA